MDFKKIEEELEALNQQTNKLIDLVRRLQEGMLFDEPLTATMKTKLADQAKTRWLAIKTTFNNLEQEIK